MIGLYFIGVIALWLLLTWLLIRLVFRLREKKNVSLNTLMLGVILVWLGLSFWYGGGRKFYYDWKVEQMCAVDGGIKVYETVKLPEDEFNKWGQINFFDPNKAENALGKKYIYKSEKKYIHGKPGGLTIIRFRHRIYHRADKKLLAEQVRYARRGGDLPGPWNASSSSCPRLDEDILNKLFMKLQ